VSIVSTGGAPSAASAPAKPADDPNAVIKSVAPAETTLPAPEPAAAAPEQINDIKPGAVPAESGAANASDKSKKKPKLDQSDESSSKKKKKKGLSKLNPF
jgi:outer membrane protein assembly factor BamD